MKDTLLSLLRHGLTAGGAVLVSHGLISSGTLDTVAGALVGLIGALWGAWDEYAAAKAAKSSTTNTQPPAQ